MPRQLPSAGVQWQPAAEATTEGDIVRSRLVQKSRRIRLLYRERGLAQVLLHLARTGLASLYSRQVQYITLKRLDRPEATISGNGTAEEGETECLVVESPEALQALAQEIPSSFRDSVDALKMRLAQGCVMFLARRPSKDGSGKEVVGYDLSERGIFSALGRGKTLSADVVFGHHIEVLPAYRGERIVNLIAATRNEYFRQQGVRIQCGVISPQNHAALRYSHRRGSKIVGTVQRISFLRGLFVWETPWEKIERALGVLDKQEVPLESQQRR